MIVLAIDPAKRLGWAVGEVEGGVLAFGALEMPAPRKVGHAAYMHHFHASVTRLAMRHGADWLVYEEPVMGGNRSAIRQACRQEGAMLLAAHLLAIPVVGVNQSTAKAFAAPKEERDHAGAATKEDVASSMQSYYGVNTRGDLDASDALAVLYWAQEHLEG